MVDVKKHMTGLHSDNVEAHFTRRCTNGLSGEREVLRFLHYLKQVQGLGFRVLGLLGGSWGLSK